ncbi:MAG: amidohydrolase family protein [Clostridia bacterium]|nr:amidohydrolase family protein [Clostridia bacterium]
MKKLYVGEFHPRSELALPGHPDALPPFPVIDMHAHFGPLLLGEDYEATYDTRRTCETLKELGIEKVLCLELVWGEEYDRLCRKLAASDGMILPVGSVDVFRAMAPDFEATVYRTLRDLKSKGCVALKLWQNMTLMGEAAFGKNLRLDDPHYEPIWRACGELGLPIVIHVADPPCFFRPIDEQNEHYVCLSRHPEWSFYRPGMFSFEEHMDMQEAVIRDHPDTTFVVAHVGSWAENLPRVGEWLDRYPNMYVDVAARVDQLGRQPYTARDFIVRHQDRVLFGTDYEGHFTMDRARGFYHTHFRFFQTRDEYFDHPFPDFLGQWKVCGLGLEEDVLRKLYRDNAKRIFQL